MKPTQSVVEVHKPCDLAAPDPKAADMQNILKVVQVKVKDAVSQL